MIKLCLYKKIEKQYTQEIQSLCKTLSFGLVIKNISTSNSKEFDQQLFENIIKKAQKKDALLNIIIMAIGPSFRRTFSTFNATYS